MASANGAARTVVVDGRMMYQPQCAGIARVTAQLLRHLPAGGKTEVVLMLPEGAPRRPDLDAWAAASLPTIKVRAAIGRPYQVGPLFPALRKLNAGVLYSPYHALAPLAVPCPSVVAVHDCLIEADWQLAGSRAKWLAYRLNSERAIRRAAAITVPSEATRAVLPRYYRHLPSVAVCPNGVDAAAWAAGPDDLAEARRALPLPARFILHVGARRPHKNQETLVRALTMMRDDIGLVLVGARDPRVTDPTSGLAAELGVSHRVVEVERASDGVLRGLYHGAGAFAFPSLAEGFGLPPLEAMAAGLPVVASAIPAVAEACRDAAIYVSPYSPSQWAGALERAVVDTPLRATLVRAGRQVAAAASWRAGAERLYSLLASVAGGEGAGA